MTDEEHVNASLGDPAGDGDQIAPRIVRPLRAAERLDATFAARVMSAVHAEARGRERAAASSPTSSASWWTRTRSIQISPLGGLAIAAGIAGLAVLGAIGRDRVPGRPDVRAPLVQAAAPETVHVVRFVFTDPDANAVSLVGDFNAWSRDATPLAEETRDGTWVVSVELPRGRHEYAFVVRGSTEERWAADPSSLPVRDDFGTESSVVTVGGARRSAERPGET